MTLIITDLSAVGIVMIADTAMTRLATGEPVNDGRKLQRVPYLNAGLSMWGRGNLPTLGNIRTDQWTARFIADNGDATSLGEFAQRLASQLRQLLPDPVRSENDWLGFHLAGYVRGEPKRPCLHHIRNIDIPDGVVRPYEFSAEPEKDVLETVPRGEHREWRNGDFGPYAVITDALNDCFKQLAQTYGIDFSRMSLAQTVTYHSAWIRFMSDMYAAAGRERTIGDTVLTLAISSDGTIDDSLTNCT
jgi:hypothetical protein